MCNWLKKIFGFKDSGCCCCKKEEQKPVVPVQEAPVQSVSAQEEIKEETKE